MARGSRSPQRSGYWRSRNQAATLAVSAKASCCQVRRIEVMRVPTGRRLGEPQDGLLGGAHLDIDLPTIEERRRQRVEAARRGDWMEIQPDELERHGPYLVDVSTGGTLYELVHAAVLHGDGNYPQASDAVAFFVDDAGEPVFLKRPSGDAPRTLAQLREREQRRERERADAERQRRDALEARPKRQLLLGELEYRGALPTLSEAAAVLERNGCRIQLGEFGELDILVPDQFGDRDSVIRASRVLLAGHRVVLSELASRSKKPLSQRLPDSPVSGGGGVVRPAS